MPNLSLLRTTRIWPHLHFNLLIILTCLVPHAHQWSKTNVLDLSLGSRSTVQEHWASHVTSLNLGFLAHELKTQPYLPGTLLRGMYSATPQWSWLPIWCCSCAACSSGTPFLLPCKLYLANNRYFSSKIIQMPILKKFSVKICFLPFAPHWIKCFLLSPHKDSEQLKDKDIFFFSGLPGTDSAA